MIREEYKNAFLNEKNRKSVIIKFTKTEEYIDSSQIVDQGSFKYVESSNDSNEIQLGYAESTSFEVDIKGNLVNRTGEEIYVELVAYEEKEEEIKVYPIPIGFFVISEVEYDYKMDFSHILSYNSASSKVGLNNAITFPRTAFTSIPSTWLYNFYTNGVPSGYFAETEPIVIQKRLLPDTYERIISTWHENYEYVSSTSQNYHYYCTKRVGKYKICEYTIRDDSRYNEGYKYSIISYCSMDADSLRQSISNEENNYKNLINNFLENNPLYKYVAYQGKTETTDTYKGNALDWGVDYIHPDSQHFYDYNLTGSSSNRKTIRLIEEKYYTFDYRSYTSSYYQEMPSGTAVRYSFSTQANINDFADVNMIFHKIEPYYILNFDVVKSGATSWIKEHNTSVVDLVSDLAELNGQMVRSNRLNGELEIYSYALNDELFPSENIYPNSSLYPKGDANILKITKDMYSSLICKNEQSKRVGKVTLKRNYNSWTAQVEDYDEKYYSKIDISEDNFWVYMRYSEIWQPTVDNILNIYKDNIFTPFELECTGLPWLEAGDWIIVETDDGQQRLNVNRRTLSGIQGMMDSLSAGGI